MKSKRGITLSPDTIFQTYSGGVKTNRDVWAYNFNKEQLADDMKRMIDFYNQQVKDFQRAQKQNTKLDIERFIDNDPKKISWDSTLKRDFDKGNRAEFKDSRLRKSLYRPFTREWLYFDRQLNNSVHRMPSFFPVG